jgi:hypothetical protein
MGYTLRHCRFLDLVGFGLALLRCLLVGLTMVHCLCCPCSPVFLLRLAYFLPLPEVSGMFCSLYCMSGHSFSIKKREVYMAWSVQHIVW